MSSARPRRRTKAKDGTKYPLHYHDKPRWQPGKTLFAMEHDTFEPSEAMAITGSASGPQWKADGGKVIRLPSGDFYQGGMNAAGQMHATDGIFYNASGAMEGAFYRGPFVDNLMHGEASLKWRRDSPIWQHGTLAKSAGPPILHRPFDFKGVYKLCNKSDGPATVTFCDNLGIEKTLIGRWKNGKFIHQPLATEPHSGPSSEETKNEDPAGNVHETHSSSVSSRPSSSNSEPSSSAKRKCSSSDAAEKKKRKIVQKLLDRIKWLKEIGHYSTEQAKEEGGKIVRKFLSDV